MATSSLRRPIYDNMMCPAPSFPDNFNEFFHTLHEDDDSVDLIATMLEDKLIPRSDTSSESGGMSKDFDSVLTNTITTTTTPAPALAPTTKRTCRRGMSARHYKRRSSDLHSNNKLPPNQQQQLPESCSTQTVIVNRRRSSSIAVTRQPPDLHRFLQTEQNRPWGYLNPNSSPPARIHLSPNHNTTAVSPVSTSPVFSPARIHLSPGTSPSARERDVSNSPSPRRGHTPTFTEQHHHHHHQHQRTRSRTASMPVVPRHRPTLAETRRTAIQGDSEEDVEYYRCRSFSITANGIFNLGDSLKSRRSRSINSVTSTGTSCSGNSANRDRDRCHSNASQNSTSGEGETENEVPCYKVGMLGASGVGKTALTYQFTTSEYICAYDASLDEEYGQKTVSVMLDGQETELEIVDHPAVEMSVESFCATYNVDVFVVVYSVVDRKTLKVAEEILLYLWKNDYMSSKAVILVGNKADLERKREVPMVVGRRLANSCGCKFIETSSGLDHNVDELLVGILAQVKLNPKRNRDKLSRKRKVRIGSGRRILKHLLGLKRKTKSCENLFVL